MKAHVALPDHKTLHIFCLSIQFPKRKSLYVLIEESGDIQKKSFTTEYNRVITLWVKFINF